MWKELNEFQKLALKKTEAKLKQHHICISPSITKLRTDQSDN